MNWREYTDFRVEIDRIFQTLRPMLASGMTEVKIHIYDTPVTLVRVGDYHPYKCDVCFNQLICSLRQIVRSSTNKYVDQCLFFREEPVELMKLNVEQQINRLMEESDESD